MLVFAVLSVFILQAVPPVVVFFILSISFALLSLYYLKAYFYFIGKERSNSPNCKLKVIGIIIASIFGCSAFSVFIVLLYIIFMIQFNLDPFVYILFIAEIIISSLYTEISIMISNAIDNIKKHEKALDSNVEND